MNKGFTLSEILITLGVIGVVAAITIPGLISNQKWRVYKTQTLRVISMLNQANRLYQNEFDSQPICGYWVKNPYESSCKAKCIGYDEQGRCKGYKCQDGSDMPADYNGNFQDCAALWDFYKSSLKVAQICNGNAFRDGCIPEYKGLDTIKKNENDGMSDADAMKKISGCAGYSKSDILTKSNAIVLLDGTILVSYGKSGSRLFLIDTNGRSGPNKWGYDLRAVMSKMPDAESYPFVTGGGCEGVEKGGKTTNKLLYNK